MKLKQMGKQRVIAAIELFINQDKRPFRTEGIEITYRSGVTILLGRKSVQQKASMQLQLVNKILAVQPSLMTASLTQPPRTVVYERIEGHPNGPSRAVCYLNESD